LVAAAVVGAAVSASAHVTVHPDSTVAGRGAQLTFRVPDESVNASTVKLVVTLPQDRPFTDVSTRAMPGWTAAVRDAPLPQPADVGGATITMAPRTVTWTAQPGNWIAPGQYQEFAFATDALPAAGEVLLPATQYYSDGSVTHWSDPALPSGAEPEHPVPGFLATVPGAAVPDATAAALGQASQGTPPAGGATDDWARALGGVALLVALVTGALALRRGRPTADVG
jgi:uncharacterized protein YcnI